MYLFILVRELKKNDTNVTYFCSISVMRPIEEMFDRNRK